MNPYPKDKSFTRVHITDSNDLSIPQSAALLVRGGTVLEKGVVVGDTDTVIPGAIRFRGNHIQMREFGQWLDIVGVNPEQPGQANNIVVFADDGESLESSNVEIIDQSIYGVDSMSVNTLSPAGTTGIRFDLITSGQSITAPDTQGSDGQVLISNGAGGMRWGANVPAGEMSFSNSNGPWVTNKLLQTSGTTDEMVDTDITIAAGSLTTANPTFTLISNGGGVILDSIKLPFGVGTAAVGDVLKSTAVGANVTFDYFTPFVAWNNTGVPYGTNTSGQLTTDANFNYDGMKLTAPSGEFMSLDVTATLTAVDIVNTAGTYTNGALTINGPVIAGATNITTAELNVTPVNIKSGDITGVSRITTSNDITSATTVTGNDLVATNSIKQGDLIVQDSGITGAIVISGDILHGHTAVITEAVEVGQMYLHDTLIGGFDVLSGNEKTSLVTTEHVKTHTLNEAVSGDGIQCNSNLTIENKTLSITQYAAAVDETITGYASPPTTSTAADNLVSQPFTPTSNGKITQITVDVAIQAGDTSCCNDTPYTVTLTVYPGNNGSGGFSALGSQVVEVATTPGLTYQTITFNQLSNIQVTAATQYNFVLEGKGPRNKPFCSGIFGSNCIWSFYSGYTTPALPAPAGDVKTSDGATPWAAVGGTLAFEIEIREDSNSKSINFMPSAVPMASGDAGSEGDFVWDDTNLYLRNSSEWKAVPLHPVPPPPPHPEVSSGTWTPTVVFNRNCTFFGTTSGIYQRVGSYVHVTANLSTITVDPLVNPLITDAFDFHVQGLPIAPDTTGGVDSGQGTATFMNNQSPTTFMVSSAPGMNVAPAGIYLYCTVNDLTPPAGNNFNVGISFMYKI